MKITLTQNKFNPNPYYDQRIKAILSDNFVKNLPGTIDTFDQNGFDLTNLERLYAKKMDYKIKKVRTSHWVLKEDWFTSELGSGTVLILKKYRKRKNTWMIFYRHKILMKWLYDYWTKSQSGTI